MRIEILNKLSVIILFLFDLEGVLLNNADSLTEDSQKKFISDVEAACRKFQIRNLNMGIVTARQRDNLIEDLTGIEKCIIISTSVEKVTAVEALSSKLKIDFDKIFYMGDEVLDIPLLTKCGFSSAPKNAKREVKRVVDVTFDVSNINTLIDDLLVLYDKSIHL